MTKPSDYQWIAAWGTFMGSMPHWVREEQQRAADSRAPLNAVWQDSSGAWHTTDDVIAPGTRATLGLDPYPPTHPRVLAAWDVTVLARHNGDSLTMTFRRLGDIIGWGRDHHVPPARITIAAGMAGKTMADPITVTYTP